MANSGGFKKGKKLNVNMSPAGHHSRQAKMKMKGKKVKKAKKLTAAASQATKASPVTMVDKTRAKAMKMLSKGGY